MKHTGFCVLDLKKNASTGKFCFGGDHVGDVKTDPPKAKTDPKQMKFCFQ